MLAMFMQSHAAADTAKAVAKAAEEWNRYGMDSIEAGNGVTITIVGMFVVFSALAIMSGTIYYLVVLSQAFIRKRIRDENAAVLAPSGSRISGEIVAAIALALEQQILQIHDDDDAVLTIKRISRPYSPWSSKLHGMTRPPFRINTQI